ncbi:MAG: ankyrin repeat domain-containing protein [Burkholderiaceae bacterium]
MYDFDLMTAVFSVALTWAIGLTPPLVIRYAILKKRMKKWPAVGVCTFLWLFNLMLFSALGSHSKTHAALSFVALVSYWILRKIGSKKEQIEQCAVVNEASGDGTTPLMGAAMLGKTKLIQEIIAAGAHIDAVDDLGWTSLMYAASRNEVDATELLLKRGANPTLRNHNNETAAEIARSKDNLEAAAVLLIHSTLINTSYEPLQQGTENGGQF